MTSLNLKGCMIIPNDFPGYSRDLFLLPKDYESSVEKLLIPSGLIQVINDRVST
jgi:hypothetical protein